MNSNVQVIEGNDGNLTIQNTDTEAVAHFGNKNEAVASLIEVLTGADMSDWNTVAAGYISKSELSKHVASGGYKMWDENDIRAFLAKRTAVHVNAYSWCAADKIGYVTFQRAYNDVLDAAGFENDGNSRENGACELFYDLQPDKDMSGEFETDDLAALIATNLLCFAETDMQRDLLHEMGAEQ
jgi:hypothetical protein